jgi:hypothetical protein
MSRFVALISIGLFAACLDSTESFDESESELGLVVRECRRHTEVIGVCGNDPEMVVACTQAFAAACTGAGGSVGPGAVPLVIHCENGSKLLHDCDDSFKTDCKAAGGTYTPDDADEEGTCTIPDRK